MARTFTNNTMYMSKASAVLTVVPMTFAAWINITTIANYPTVIEITNGATRTDFFNLFVDGVSGFAKAEISHSGTTGNAISTLAVGTSAWYHVCSVFASATSRIVYVNGGNSGTDATNITPSGLTLTSMAGDAVGNEFDGTFAFPAIWNVALSAADVASLATGVHPRLVHPEALVACLNLTGGNSPEPDLVSATSWTLTGSSTVAANPRIYKPL